MKTNKYTFRVYYEDTDMAGVVYYANYLRFIERARSDHVREIGIDQLEMKDDLGVVFVVRRIEADYVQAARFGDVLEIESWLSELTGVRMVYQQIVRRGESLVFSASVTVVCMNNAGRPVRFPADIRQKLEKSLH